VQSLAPHDLLGTVVEPSLTGPIDIVLRGYLFSCLGVHIKC
jgi:hypothetical protein